MPAPPLKDSVAKASATIAAMYMAIVAVVTWAAVRKNWSYRPLIVGGAVAVLTLLAYHVVPRVVEKDQNPR